jgi:sialate O-acetylesterase
MKLSRWLPLLLIVATPFAARADVRPNALCTEGMVLQQKSKVKIWGDADKGEKVAVTFRGKTANAQADDDGRWVAVVETGDAGGPFEMKIAGNNTIDLKDVLVGEVWVCSGQSNMEWSVNACDASDKNTAKGEPANANLRMFTVKRTTPATPQKDTAGKWTNASPETVGNFSATGYFFGRDLNKNLKVPVGLIHTSWGGTRAEAWTRKEVLDKNPLFEHEHAKPVKAGNANAPSVLYNGMIAPILNYGIKGAIWYQGESNTGNAYAYRTLFPLMIENWRKDFGQGDFPFYFVQLAPFTSVAKTPGEASWAELREAQNVALKMPNTGVAVITDFGNEYDIHPTPKRPVGERLALCARALTYGEKVPYSGPMYKTAKFGDGKAVVSFDHVGGGLVAKKLVATQVRTNKNGAESAAWRVDPDAKDVELTGFAICGKDQKWVNAKAVIQGDTVVVSSPDVAEPVAVRYGWANHPICGLFNRDGLPASPFRTDDFKVSTQK